MVEKKLLTYMHAWVVSELAKRTKALGSNIQRHNQVLASEALTHVVHELILLLHAANDTSTAVTALDRGATLESHLLPIAMMALAPKVLQAARDTAGRNSV